MTASWEVREGDALERLREMPDESVQCCVTSPPYFGLRDYGIDGQIGLEPTPDEFVARLVEVFREVRRVLRDDGTLWLNIGDSYTKLGLTRLSLTNGGLKEKDLLGIPWLLAFALRADGWWLRSEIIWAKRNCMPESVTDRPTKTHEQIFLLAKSARYFYDHDTIREPDLGNDHPRSVLNGQPSLEPSGGLAAPHSGLRTASGRDGQGANKRSVWWVATYPYAAAHFATFPPDLIEPCILAGARVGDRVLDPFAGAGTTGLVALRHDRSFIGIELSPVYAELARNRIRDDAPLLNTPAEAAA